MRILSALTALLTGCNSSPKVTVAPDHPGTLFPLAYPILLLGNDVPVITVIDTETQFTTTTVASSMIYTTDRIVDSAGKLYAVNHVGAAGKMPSPWKGMGNVPYRLFWDLKAMKPVDTEQARQMVLERVRNPRNQLSRPPERLRSAEEAIRGYRTLQELIAGCATQSDWY